MVVLTVTVFQSNRSKGLELCFNSIPQSTISDNIAVFMECSATIYGINFTFRCD